MGNTFNSYVKQEEQVSTENPVSTNDNLPNTVEVSNKENVNNNVSVNDTILEQDTELDKMENEIKTELEPELKEVYENKYDDEYDEEDKYIAPIIGHTKEGKEIKLGYDGSILVDFSVPGKFFNEMYTNCKIVKLTSESCIHNGFEFVEGLNIDVNEFKNAEVCGPDGLYFCAEKDADHWFDYRDGIKYAWDVTIPDDARVVVYDNKIKSNKFILSNKRHVTDLIIHNIETMIISNKHFMDVIEYVDYNYCYFTELDEKNTQLILNKLDKLMISLIAIDFTAYSQMPDYLKTKTVNECVFKSQYIEQFSEQ